MEKIWVGTAGFKKRTQKRYAGQSFRGGAKPHKGRKEDPGKTGVKKKRIGSVTNEKKLIRRKRPFKKKEEKSGRKV